ncbi:hypothetical protein PG985_009588 [Apiospora marii]|uniref:2EXR domain-containing protein n=1 Tax=Apiospora marii TaxID=335849 RepID=A0ABR1RG51_9PEZI
MSFPQFAKLPPELRHMVWDEALREEIGSRLILVHRTTMRVIPHKGTQSLVMNANRESRYYARLMYYDVKLDVWTVKVDLDVENEVYEYDRKPAGQHYTAGLLPMGVYSGLYGELRRAQFTASLWLNQLRPKIQSSINQLLNTHSARKLDEEEGSQQEGCIFVSSQHDRFALARTTRTSDATSWGAWSVDMCVRAFMRDYVCRDMRQAIQDRTRLMQGAQEANDDQDQDASPVDYLDQFQATHMAERLPRAVQRRIRHVVNLGPHPRLQTTGPVQHICGPSTLYARDWKLGTFKGARYLYTGYMLTIPSSMDLLGPNRLVEWTKTEGENGRLGFSCVCETEDDEDGGDEGIND